MMTDTEIKLKGVKTLIKTLGIVEAERFIALMSREPFDYTEWQRSLWTNESIKEISKKAMEFRKSNSK